MEMGMFQKQTMKLAMTPALRQAISLLQYSNHELYDFIHDQALENPLIDLQHPSTSTTLSQTDMGVSNNASSSSSTGYSAADLPFKDMKSQSLQDDLLQQARYQTLDSNSYDQLLYLIYHIDETGYLPKDIVERTADIYAVSAEHIQTVLAVLQSFEPHGVGARYLQECLWLQTQGYDEQDQKWLRTLIEDYLTLIAEQKWSAISQELGLRQSELDKYIRLIQNMDPKPGEQYSSEPVEYIHPDATIKMEGGQPVVYIHDHFLPHIQFNAEYHQLFVTPPANMKYYMKTKYKHMLWLQRSIAQRRDTLGKVLEAVARRQRTFCVHGAKTLQPLTMKDIAADVDVHESTVSRTVKGKYVQTPVGLYDLKYFFSAELSKGENTVSAESVKILMKEIIAEEDKQHPLSDQQISEQVMEVEGIAVSRRTIAKYRKALKMAASSRRKIYT